MHAHVDMTNSENAYLDMATEHVIERRIARDTSDGHDCDVWPLHMREDHEGCGVRASIADGMPVTLCSYTLHNPPQSSNGLAQGMHE